MKKIVYEKDKFDTKDAHNLMLEIENELGVSLHVADPHNPNNVNGYINTGSDGTVEVYLYEQADKERIDAMPQYAVHPITRVLHKVKEHIGIYKVHTIADELLATGVEKVLSKRGFTAKLTADGKKIHKL